MAESLYLMSPMEITWGYVVGHAGTLSPPTDETLTPRQALERVLRRALQRPPCGVAFSGGRDSSAVLAVATHVARREGLPEPVAITRVFPDAPAADEHEWQEQVVRHLGVREWQRLVIHDELDVIGPIATRHLLEHGVVWPPAIAGDAPMAEVVQGGTLLDGEGGDDVLGVGAHRVAPLTHLVRAPRPVRLRRLRTLLDVFAPAPVRFRQTRRYVESAPARWMRPAAMEALLAAMETVERRRPVSYAASVRMVPRRRTQVLGARNRRILAARHGVEVTSPLLHPEFVHALARDGGVLGRGDRTAALRALVPDLLPDAVLSRTSKATFNSCYMARYTREFATRWDGDGVDPELVDPVELRRAWLADPPLAPTMALLQAAWLAPGQRAAPPATVPIARDRADT